MHFRQTAVATILLLSATCTVMAQVPNGNDFDPATRAAQNLSATRRLARSAGRQPAPPIRTLPPVRRRNSWPSSSASSSWRRSRRSVKRRKRKAAAAEKARKEKEAAAKDADAKRMAAQKADREKAMADRKQAREQLKDLEKEETTARKAYRDSLGGLSGDARHAAEEAFQKSEADRRKKIAELRHPKMKKSTDSSSTTTPGSSSSSGATGATTTH